MNIKVEDLPIFFNKAENDFVLAEVQSYIATTTSRFNNFMYHINNEFIKLGDDGEEFFDIHIRKNPIRNIIVDDFQELGWKMYFYFDNGSKVVLTYNL